MKKEPDREKSDRLWSAYLDGELSSAEALEYDSALSPGERERFEAEKRFESLLDEQLSPDATCPDELWKRVVAEVENVPRQERLTPLVFWRRMSLGAVAASILLLVFATIYLRNDGPSGESVAQNSQYGFLTAVPVSELALLAEVEGDEAAVTSFLAERGIPIEVLPVAALSRPNESAHETFFLGACERQVGEDRVVELMWSCCGEPVVMKVVVQRGVAAGRIHKAVENDEIIGFRRFEDHVVALVGGHASSDFLKLLQPISSGVT